MKPTLYTFTLIFMFLIQFEHAYSHSNGAPAGYTGSPGDAKNCTQCHGGTASTVTGYITTNIPPQGYTAGTTYSITVTIPGSGGKGFELSPQNPAGAQLGFLEAGSNSHLTGGTEYVTHNSAISANPAVWTFSWTAPSAGTGNVNLYAAYAITESTTRLQTLTLTEAMPLSVMVTATPMQICAGSSSQLNATASGGSGSYSYSWTSNPPGFTSALQNPVVSPAMSTQYNCQVSDGTSSASGGAMVTVTAQATSFAGSDTTVSLQVISIPLNGVATNYSSVLWTTSGDGTFSSTTSLISQYYPGNNDRLNGAVSLTLTSYPQSPCTTPASSVRHITIAAGTGLSEAEADQTITVGPNPSDGRFNLGLQTTNWPGSGTLQVYNTQGQLVYNEAIEVQEPKVVKSVDLRNVGKGIYLLRLTISGKPLNTKLLIY